ncbi:putative chitosanase [Morchella snyderi]|nr:putative chitosanase [Morchella snyderi]
MIFNTLITTLLFALLTLAHARSVPPNVQEFYNKVKGGLCPVTVAKGFSQGSSSSESNYCFEKDQSVMWIASSGGLADMDIDCDGANHGYGKCSNDPTGQGMTSFVDHVKKLGLSDLDSNTHSFIVLGNSGFDPQSVGIEPLSLVAVVCGAKMFYGIWGDSNATDKVGEASIALATACYGDGMTGNSGHNQHDVLYLAFPGKDAAVKDSANWHAGSFSEFEDSLSSVGDKMVAGVHAY